MWSNCVGEGGGNDEMSELCPVYFLVTSCDDLKD